MIRYKEKDSYSSLGSRKSWNIFKEKGYFSTLDSRKSWEDFRFKKEEEENVTLKALEGSRYR